MTELTLEGMTNDKWDRLGPAAKDKLRDLSDLSPQLVGLEGWRVEVEDMHGETRRFVVGRSTGWRPIHIELKLRTSDGGMAAAKEYRSVRKIEKVR